MIDPSRRAHQILKFASAEDLPRAYAFGPFRFDPHDRVLYRAGAAVPLSPKAAELLLLFMQSRGRLLSKEVLISSLWPETFVEESSLSQTVFLLRKALGDAPGSEAWIDTVPRRGFRFSAPIAHVDSLADDSAPPTRATGWRAGAIAAAIALAVIATFAVALRRETPKPVVSGELIPAGLAPEAREAYLKGRYYWNRRTVPDFRKALDYFRAATEREPRFALAWAGLADAYNFLGQAPRAKIAAQRALEIDSNCAPAHAALANAALFYDFDWRTADRSFERAVNLDPSYATARHWRAFLLVSQRRFAEAKREIERARELDPLSKIITTDVGLIHFYSGDYDRAIAHYRRALELDPTFLQARGTLGWAYLLKGDLGRAAEEFERGNAGRVAEVAILCARGETDRARAILADLEKQDPETRIAQRVSAIGMARSFVAVGDHPRALVWLARAHDSHEGDVALVHVDPQLDPLRSDPAFIEFLRTRGLALQ